MPYDEKLDARIREVVSTWEGVSGKITFDKNHNPIKAAVVLQVKDGKVVYVATVAP